MNTNKSRHAVSFRFAVGLALLLATSGAMANLSSFNEDFESLDLSSSSALGDAGWLVFGNVFDPAGNYLYGYGAFPAPNYSGGFSAIVDDQGAAAQGLQQLAVFSDYNNSDHSFGNLIESNVFQEYTIATADAGSAVRFSFDAKAGDILNGFMSTANAFIKIIDPGTGFSLTEFVFIDTTNLTLDWNTYSLTLLIDATWADQLLQFGFSNTAAYFEPSAVFYDNVRFAPVPIPGAMWLLLSGVVGLVSVSRKR